jgi:ActR/RegA family two-component response regulator
MKIMVFVLDDEKNIRQDLYKHLNLREYEVCTAGTIGEAISIIQSVPIDFALIDLKIDFASEYGGIRVIEKLNAAQPEAKAIVLSAYEMDDDIVNMLDRVSVYGYVSKGGSGNYIKAVLSELDRLREEDPPKQCFVIMPFSKTKSCSAEQWKDIFDNTIKPAVENAGFNYKCFRANLAIGNIVKDILDNLNNAEVVIADMTDKNPNVFYELGVRHALKNATILITQNIKDIPFDLRHYATLQYDWTTQDGKDRFKVEIKKVLGEIESDPDGENILSPVREYLKLK